MESESHTLAASDAQGHRLKRRNPKSETLANNKRRLLILEESLILAAILPMTSFTCISAAITCACTAYMSCTHRCIDLVRIRAVHSHMYTIWTIAVLEVIYHYCCSIASNEIFVHKDETDTEADMLVVI